MSFSGLAGLDNLEVKSPAPSATVKPKPIKAKPKKITFVEWYSTKKAELQMEFPEMSAGELTTRALKIYKEEFDEKEKPDVKKRKLNGEGSKSTSEKLAAFAFKD